MEIKEIVYVYTDCLSSDHIGDFDSMEMDNQNKQQSEIPKRNFHLIIFKYKSGYVT